MKCQDVTFIRGFIQADHAIGSQADRSSLCLCDPGDQTRPVQSSHVSAGRSMETRTCKQGDSDLLEGQLFISTDVNTPLTPNVFSRDVMINQLLLNYI